MGKSVNGPDMLDCLQYWAEMDKQGGLFTSIMLLHTGSVAAPFVIFTLLSTPCSAATLPESCFVSAYSGYPSREHQSFNGAFYRALIDHDKYLSSEKFFRSNK